MENKSLNTFLTKYINCLAERTRKEKGDIKVGFDWIIYQIGLADNWIPVRLPFFRHLDSDVGQAKSEPEYGIDFSFLTSNREELLIFVLKAEELKNKTWTAYNFDTDLRKAAAPDLTGEELSNVKSVKVILAYNKDEDKFGIKLFENLTSSLGIKIGDKSLVFERWNLSRIVEEVKTHLFSPDLLPQHLSGLFSYVCSEASDFDFNSTEWEKQLVPNWKYFLKILLEEPVDERKIRLVPVSLLILYERRKKTANSLPGWIDLIEWAMLPLWRCYGATNERKLKYIIIEIWFELYIAQLEHYFMKILPTMHSEHGFHSMQHVQSPTYLVSINDAYIAFWHLARLGILTLASGTFVEENVKNDDPMLSKWIQRSADWLLRCLRMNPSTMRPLIDLNHIELFLTWSILFQANKKDEIYEWFSELESRLLVRRIRNASLPFIDGGNRMDLVAEYVITSQKPFEFIDNSSYLLLMILELCFSLDENRRDELLNRYYKRIIQGIGDDEESLADFEIDLIGWAPPDNWEKRILEEQVNDGTAITTNNFQQISEDTKPLFKRIEKYIQQTREKFPFKIPENIPFPVFILACIKNQSPLPSEFWRGIIFPEKQTLVEDDIKQ